VFIGHGYGTILIEKLHAEGGEANKSTNELLEYTATIGFFAPPFTGFKDLINWTAQSLNISTQHQPFSLVRKAFVYHKSGKS
jgi:hypothetical protein